MSNQVLCNWGLYNSRSLQQDSSYSSMYHHSVNLQSFTNCRHERHQATTDWYHSHDYEYCDSRYLPHANRGWNLNPLDIVADETQEYILWILTDHEYI